MEWIASTLRFMAAEAREPRLGGETVITRLADILVIQAIRSWIEQDPAAQTGWLGALRDPQIGRAISLIHRDPARTWTVASLADEVAMSRSAFAARFAELVGEPPMHYVTRWRMHAAVTWLREDDATLGELALRLGYQSEAAFSRAFKRFMGLSPGAVRRTSATTSGGFVHDQGAQSARRCGPRGKRTTDTRRRTPSPLATDYLRILVAVEQSRDDGHVASTALSARRSRSRAWLAPVCIPEKPPLSESCSTTAEIAWAMR